MSDINITDPANWWARYSAERAAHDEMSTKLLPGNKATLFDALAAAGITHVVVTFDGYGDSGQIEDTEVKAGDEFADLPTGNVTLAIARWGQAEAIPRDMPIAEAIETLVYDLLELTHAGWENNEGAFGDFTFDVADRSITLDYNERYERSELYQHTF